MVSGRTSVSRASAVKMAAGRREGMGRAYTDAETLLATQIAYLDCSEYQGYTLRQILDALTQKYQGHGELDKFGKKELGVLEHIRNMISENGLEKALDWKIRDVGDYKESGMYACLIDTADGNAIVGYRGSESYNAEQFRKDWLIADFTLLNKNGTTAQENDALDYMERVARKYGDDYSSIAATGHSLGGHLAEHVTINAPSSIRDKMECTNFDGPGFSDEYQRNHAEEIRKNGDKIRHYQWSLVGGLLNPTPGSDFQTIRARDPDAFGDPFLRHDTENVVLDENGKIIPADIDPIGGVLSVSSKILENWKINPLNPNSWKVPVVTVIVTLEAVVVTFLLKEGRDFIDNAVDWLRKSFREKFGHSVRGEYEVNTRVLLRNAGKYGQTENDIRRIAEEAERIEKSLQYDSVSGGLTKAAIWRICGSIERDGKYAGKLEEALYKTEKLYFDTDRAVTDRFDGL